MKGLCQFLLGVVGFWFGYIFASSLFVGLQIHFGDEVDPIFGGLLPGLIGGTLLAWFLIVVVTRMWRE